MTQYSKGWIDTDWTDFSIRTFVLLKPNVSRAAANEKVKDIIFNIQVAVQKQIFFFTR